jgi:glutamate-5-semialdehyde dehydrogenase
MNLQNQILEMGRRAHAASRALAKASTEQKNAALLAMADSLERETSAIIAANTSDLARANANGLSGAMIDRLTLNPKRVNAMADGIRQVAALPDPVGENLRDWTRPNGIHITKIRVPIGVVGIIYESRPNVTSDAAVLCTKTGNATILRGGSESIDSNLAIASALQHGLAHAGLPADSILLVPTTDREAVKFLCEMDQYLNVIVPRGGKSLIEAVVSHARMPVIKHYDGLCIMYVDREADLEMASRLVLNAKTQRPGVCNAIETVLVHREIAADFFATTGQALLEKKVQLRCDDASFSQLSAFNSQLVLKATDADWRTEFLDHILAVKIVETLEDAVAHIDEFGSHHSDAIITRNAQSAEQFLNEVDSATVYWNASTRFTDGGEFGFGAEIGISTDRLHARGPMALEELTTYKYQIRGTGQIRE